MHVSRGVSDASSTVSAPASARVASLRSGMRPYRGMPRDTLDRTRDAIAVAGAGLSLVERLAALFRTDPKRKARRLRARAAKLRVRAAALNERPFDWPRRDRLRRQADVLEAQAAVLDP